MQEGDIASVHINPRVGEIHFYTETSSGLLVSLIKLKRGDKFELEYRKSSKGINVRMYPSRRVPFWIARGVVGSGTIHAFGLPMVEANGSRGSAQIVPEDITTLRQFGDFEELREGRWWTDLLLHITHIYNFIHTNGFGEKTRTRGDRSIPRVLLGGSNSRGRLLPQRTYSHDYEGERVLGELYVVPKGGLI